MIDLGQYVRPGDGIWWSQASAEPRPLVHALLDQVDMIGPVRGFCGLTWDKRLAAGLPKGLQLSSYGALGVLRELSYVGQLDIVPCNYSALPRLFADGTLPHDVGFVQVSPPDENGLCSLGIGVDYAADAVLHTRVLIAEINRQMPVTTGSLRLPLERFAAVVETDRPLLEAPGRCPDEVERAIARAVAEVVRDGDTVQIGVGPLPSAVLKSLHGHSDLGIHSGMIADGVAALIDDGVVTGAHKRIDAGIAVTGAALGSARLYERIGELQVHFRPASYTHAPETLAQLDNLVSINSAIEVDLTGQVGSEIRHGVYVGAVGGQADFSRAAALTGARSIIALRSRAGSESTIKLELDGPISTARSDVDVVVTEYGAAHLRGLGVANRARRLIEIAAPEHRDDLARAFAASDLSD